jgi:hypothetical protein
MKPPFSSCCLRKKDIRQEGGKEKQSSDAIIKQDSANVAWGIPE